MTPPMSTCRTWTRPGKQGVLPGPLTPPSTAVRPETYLT